MLRLLTTPLAAFTAALAIFHASPAAAAPTARLVYSRTADAMSCPNEDVLRKAVAARVGYDPFFAWAPRTVVANLAREGNAYVAAVDLIDEQGLAHGARALRTEARARTCSTPSLSPSRSRSTRRAFPAGTPRDRRRARTPHRKPHGRALP